MKTPSCIRAGALIAARAAGLSRADGLWLEEHTGSCADCSREALLLTNVRAIAQSFDSELSAEARGYVLQRALREHSSHTRVPGRNPLHRFALGFGLAASIAAVALGIRAYRGHGATTEHAAELAQRTSTASQVEPALLAPSEAAIAQLQSGLRVHVHARTQVTLAHASVELTPESEAQWNAAAHELSLLAGEALAEVDPAPHQPFAIVTPKFRAEVLGTRFEVTQTSVNVMRGRVRVVTSDGIERAILNAGERYAYGATQDADESAAEREAPAARDEPRSTSNVNVPAMLTQARDALAAGRFDRSRQAIDSALAAKPARAARAEALTLRAEVLSAEGNQVAAVGAYLDVADRFASLAAGENALFAAARMHADKIKAKALLQRYLGRYPHGRFVVEAKYRLDRLSK